MMNHLKKTKSRVRNLLAGIKALHAACYPITIQNAFEQSGLWPRDKSMSLKNPRITISAEEHPEEDTTITLKSSKRKRISIQGTIATSDIIIGVMKAQEEEEKKGYD